MRNHIARYTIGPAAIKRASARAIARLTAVVSILLEVAKTTALIASPSVSCTRRLFIFYQVHSLSRCPRWGDIGVQRKVAAF